MLEKVKEKFGLSKEKFKCVCASAIVTAMSMNITVLASENKYAKNASGWVQSGVQSLVIAAAAVIVGMNIIKRKFVNMLVTVFVAAIIVAIVYNPNILKNIGEYMTGVIFGS
jgi:ABC-type uncharacterized transport system permease subunit